MLKFMGSSIEFNDTLNITHEQGFPRELYFEKHLKNPFKVEDFKGRVFSFKKENIRLFNIPPCRTLLVQNINEKWLCWGYCDIIEQTINSKENTTSGKFVITKIYSPERMKIANDEDVKRGKEFFF